MAKRPGVLHVARSVSRGSYGVGAIARALVSQQVLEGQHAACWSTDRSEDLEEVRAECPGGVMLRGFGALGPRRLGVSPRLMRACVAGEAGGFDLLHQHSLWSAASAATNRWRRKFSRPTVIAPHGTLERWALGRSPLNKRLARLAYEDRNLREASCLHATGEQEIESFRAYGLKNPIAYIPNGVSDEWIESVGDGARFRESHGVDPDKRLMLYLSRVTPKKGIPMLIEAMDRLGMHRGDWQLLVAGPDEFNHLAEIEARVASCGLGEAVRHVGPLYGQTRRDAFAAAELFVLPTHSEGNPMAVLEALAVGLPVLTTTGCPCGFLDESGMGWRAPIDPGGIAEALAEAVGTSEDALADRGRSGSEYIQRHHRWSHATKSLSELYAWLLGNGPRPGTVIV